MPKAKKPKTFTERLKSNLTKTNRTIKKMGLMPKKPKSKKKKRG